MNQLKYFGKDDLKDMERFYRANLINSVTGYKPANLIGTFSDNGIANLAIFTSVVHIGANPALIGLIQRPITNYSHTYKNIKQKGFYTINHVHENFIKNAHYTSAKFDENISEFDACGLTMERKFEFDAPFVKESKIKLGVKFVQEIPIELNNTFLIIGQIEHLLISEDVIQNDGSLDLNLVNDVAVSGLDTYHNVHKLSTFPYAKKDELPEF